MGFRGDGGPLSGNSPRYPFAVGRIHLASGLLMRESVVTINKREPGDDGWLILSNLLAHQDRETGDILLHMSRALATERFSSDADLHRVAVGTCMSAVRPYD
jgi:hypothetical protein